MKNIKLLSLLGLIAVLAMNSCTTLDEEPFSVLTKDNYYRDKSSVEAVVLRAYDQMWWISGGNNGAFWIAQELTADHFVWSQKGRHGQDDGNWVRLHSHGWRDNENTLFETWERLAAGVGLVNMAMKDFNELDFEALGIDDATKTRYFAELRALRAWFNLNLYDCYRYIPIYTEETGMDELLPSASAEEVFNYIEKEVKEVVALNVLPQKSDDRTVGHFSQGAAMMLLMRLYLNAEVYIGSPRYDECKKICQDIIDGVYGDYAVDQTDYREPYRSGDIGGYRSKEYLFEIPHKQNVFDPGTFWWDHMHYASRDIFGVSWGANNGIHLQPSRDHESTVFTIDANNNVTYKPGNIYQHSSGLGNPYEKYHDADKRKQPFHQTNKGTDYQGFFLVGELKKFDIAVSDYIDEPVKGNEEYLNKPLVFIDAVGRFSERIKSAAEGSRWGEGSMVQTGEENSGVRFNKFPFLSEASGFWHAQSYPEMRLAEVYYSLAEIYLREGNTSKAAELLDYVRVRNYDSADWSKYSYSQGGITLTEQEFIDDWGREFLGEGKRRTFLIRWKRFGQTWWNKEADTVDRSIFPMPRKALDANPNLEQKAPGFNR